MRVVACSATDRTRREIVRTLKPSTGTAIALCAVGLAAIASGTLEAQPRDATEPQTIRLHRPHTAGQRVRLELTGEKHENLERRDGASWVAQRNKDLFVALAAEQRVLQVSANGSVMSADYLVRSFEVRRGETRTTPLRRGVVLHVERPTAPDARTLIMVDGQPVEDEVAEALSVVISGRPSEVDDDQVFGSTTPRRVGDRWRMNDTLAERELARAAQLEVDLSGEAQLVEMRTVQDLPCAIISGTMSGRLRGLPNLPASAQFERGTLEITQRGAFPTDGTTRAPESEMGMVLEVAFSVRAAQNQPPQQLRMTVRESRRERATVLR